MDGFRQLEWVSIPHNITNNSYGFFSVHLCQGLKPIQINQTEKKIWNAKFSMKKHNYAKTWKKCCNF